MYYLIDDDGYYDGVFYSEFQGDDWEDLTDYEKYTLTNTIGYCIDFGFRMYVLMESLAGCVQLGKIYVEEQGVNLPKMYMQWNNPYYYRGLISRTERSDD